MDPLRISPNAISLSDKAARYEEREKEKERAEREREREKERWDRASKEAFQMLFVTFGNFVNIFLHAKDL